ncbi:hypothetical protein [Rossellomorea marisflavi]|uniref:hypothetical protein n=1 Tax=Rossellomorea marisflavi TaxID=189381 RepID=UPI003FA10103
MKKRKNVFILAGTLFMSLSFLAGCQIPDERKTLNEEVRSADTSEKTSKKKWVQVGEEFPNTSYSFAGYIENGTSIAIRHYDDHETKTDYYTIIKRKVNIKGMEIQFGDIKPEDNKIEVLSIKGIH